MSSSVLDPRLANVRALISSVPCSVLIASEYEPLSVIERLLPSIGGSAPIVVYSQNVQVQLVLYLRLPPH